MSKKFLFILFILLLNASHLNNIQKLSKEIKSNNNNLNNSSSLKDHNNYHINISESRIPTGRILLYLIILLLIFIIYTTIRNTIIFNKTIKEGFSYVKNNFGVEEIDIGPLKKVQINKILPFYAKVYYIKELGVLPIVTVNIGIMQQITFNINPFEKDLPQLTIELIYFLGKRIIFVEIYDLMLDKKSNKYKDFLAKINEIKEKYNELEIIKNEKKVWYEPHICGIIRKKGKAENDNSIINIFKESLETYIEFSKSLPLLNDNEKEKKYFLIKGFSDQFVEKGGIAVNNFLNSIGKEKTREYLGKVIFGYLIFKDLNLKLYKKHYAENEAKSLEENENLIKS